MFSKLLSGYEMKNILFFPKPWRLLALRYLLFFLLVSGALVSWGQTTNSITGNWGAAGSWDNGVPAAGYTVNINTSTITIDNNYTVNTATITVGTGGILTGNTARALSGSSSFTLNGGTFR
jgi:hypothetical protein